VKTIFSATVCVILLTDFHRNISFCANMLNYLKTTFTFGKQTKDNFISREFQCTPTYSLIHSILCPLFLWRIAGAAALGGPKIAHDQQHLR